MSDFRTSDAHEVAWLVNKNIERIFSGKDMTLKTKVALKKNTYLYKVDCTGRNNDKLFLLMPLLDMIVYWGVKL